MVQITQAYWTGVLQRVKKQSEARHSKEGAVAWCEDPLSRDDSAIDADKKQRFPLLKLEQLNDQQRPFGDEILKVSSRCFRELPASQAADPFFRRPLWLG